MPNPTLYWRFLQSIREVITKSGGYVFGGFVRDSIIHDHFAQMFYKASEGEEWDYAEPTHHPESYTGRVTLPLDIDVMIDSACIPFLIAALTEAEFTCQEIPAPPHNPYAAISHDPQLVLTSYQVSMKVNPLIKRFFGKSLPIVKIDVVHKEDFQICTTFKYEKLDFECNSLYISPDGQIGTVVPKNSSTSDFLKNMERTKKIMDDCVHRVAIAVQPSSRRIEKMMYKGYKIVSSVTTLAYPTHENACQQDEDCLICMQSLKGSRYAGMNCCAAKFHFQCFARSLANCSTMYNNKGNCMMCRRDLETCGTNQEHINAFLGRGVILNMSPVDVIYTPRNFQPNI
jgi:hypothetical protein